MTDAELHGATWRDGCWQMQCPLCGTWHRVADNVIAVHCSVEHRDQANAAGLPAADGYLY